MKIIVKFLNGSEYWQNKILASAVRASEILSCQEFLDKVKLHTRFDFTNDTPVDVAERLAAASDVTVVIGFYSKFFTRAIAYEDEIGVHFNTRKERYGAGSAGDLAHELMHQLGYRHNGNSPQGNENTVPWWIGNQVDQWLS